MKVKVPIQNWFGLVFNLRGILGLINLPRFVKHWILYSKSTNDKRPLLTDLQPCLSDMTLKTSFDAHYFYQAIWLSRKLAEVKPKHHCDIGSDVQLIGIISGFVPTTFLDFRPLEVDISGLTCKEGNLLKLELPSNSIPSLSCLHVIEHIGLGRYGDQIDPQGNKKAAQELSRVLAPGGYLWLSTPVGRERLCFNAHRIVSPQLVIDLFPDIKLSEFAFVNDSGKFYHSARLEDAQNCNYGCGFFMFRKENR